MKMTTDMKIFVWGTGYAAQELLETELNDVNIIAFIDNNRQGKYGTHAIYKPEEAVKKEYDAVIVVTAYAQDIYEQALRLKFDMSKFIFVYNNYHFSDMNKNYMLAEKIFSPEYIKVIQNRYHVIRGMMKDEVCTETPPPSSIDTLECFKRIITVSERLS